MTFYYMHIVLKLVLISNAVTSYYVLKQNIFTGKLVLRVFASDGDDMNTPNGTFRFRLVSANPKTDNVEFYMTQNENVGSIYFKGCLDYEVSTSPWSLYTVLYSTVQRSFPHQYFIRLSKDYFSFFRTELTNTS